MKTKLFTNQSKFVITNATVITNITDQSNWSGQNYNGSLVGLYENNVYYDGTYQYFFDGSALIRLSLQDILSFSFSTSTYTTSGYIEPSSQLYRALVGANDFYFNPSGDDGDGNIIIINSEGTELACYMGDGVTSTGNVYDMDGTIIFDGNTPGTPFTVPSRSARTFISFGGHYRVLSRAQVPAFTESFATSSFTIPDNNGSIANCVSYRAGGLGPYTITLPEGGYITGSYISFINEDPNPMTITATPSTYSVIYVDGMNVANYIIAPGDVATFYCGGGNWRLCNSKGSQPIPTYTTTNEYRSETLLKDNGGLYIALTTFTATDLASDIAGGNLQLVRARLLNDNQAGLSIVGNKAQLQGGAFGGTNDPAYFYVDDSAQEMVGNAGINGVGFRFEDGNKRFRLSASGVNGGYIDMDSNNGTADILTIGLKGISVSDTDGCVEIKGSQRMQVTTQPATPSVGETYNDGANTYRYDGTNWIFVGRGIGNSSPTVNSAGTIGQQEFDGTYLYTYVGTQRVRHIVETVY